MKATSTNKKGFSWMHKNLLTKPTHYGFGTFAKRNIARNTLIMIFGGYIFTRSEEMKLPKRIQDIAIQIELNYVIGIKKSSELSNTDFVNHSCSPNSGIKGQISLYSMTDIKKGDEITFDYGTVLFGIKKYPTYKLKCKCNSKKCRGEITDHDWKKNIFNKRFLPFYIKEKLENQKHD